MHRPRSESMPVNESINTGSVLRARMARALARMDRESRVSRPQS
jgi:hypothetical protein